MIRIRVQFIRTGRCCNSRMILDCLVPFRETALFVGDKGRVEAAVVFQHRLESDGPCQLEGYEHRSAYRIGLWAGGRQRTWCNQDIYPS